MKASISLLALWSLTTFAQTDVTSEAQKAQVEKVRAEIAGDIQFKVYELLDELVFQWTQAPPFGEVTSVVLADVSVPVGMGSGLKALAENHFTGLVVKNPSTSVQLTHCPKCTAIVVHSGARGTVVARGFDQPEVLEGAAAQSGAKHALFLDFEIEGANMVLRARMTSLEASLPIVWAKTLSTNTSAAALLRSSDALKSADDARKEYLDVLRGRDFLLVPIRLGVRSYAPNSDGGAGISVTPFIWLQAGVETAFTQSRAWTGSLMGGVSWFPELHTAFMAQGRVARLLSGSTVSLTRPDVYLFFGGAIIHVSGLSALSFSNDTPTLQNALANLANIPASTTFGAFHTGLELRVKNRIGVSVFLETAPALNDVQNVGSFFNFGLNFQTLGVEASFCF